MADPLENESAKTLLSIKNGAVNFKSDTKIKKEKPDESMDIDEEEVPVLNPEFLGLKRVGEDESSTPKKNPKIRKQMIKQEKSSSPSTSTSTTPVSKKTTISSKSATSTSTSKSASSPAASSPTTVTPEQPLNRRGMPARVRKKNRLFFDDDVINEAPFRTWPKRGPKLVSPAKGRQQMESTSSSSFEKSKPDTPSSIKTRSSSPATVTKSQTTTSTSTTSTSTPSTPVTRRSAQFIRDDKEKLKERPEKEKDSPSSDSKISTRSSSSPTPSTSALSEKKSTIKEIKSIKPDTKEDIKESKEDWSILIPLSSPDRRAGQRIGMRLRNLLKLPKAHKWVCYEWFYSNIDKALFDGDNDFMNCLKESFPQLKTRTLTRVEWCKIRRMMGKPRRCSVAFFEEERRELERKRSKIRLLQQRKTSDVSNCKDLPGEIPLQLVIGTKVTARLRKPQDGLFTGSIDAVDTSNNTYRITFERQGLGTYSVPDYEVLSNEPPEMITLSSFAQKFRPRPMVPPYMMAAAAASGFRPGGLLTGLSPSLNEQTRLNMDPLITLKSGSSVEGQLGPFPIKFLEKIVRLNKILKEKREILSSLREMNSEAEKFNSFGWPIPDDFKQRYALVVINLDELNRDMDIILDTIHKYCDEIEPESGLRQMLSTTHLREKSFDEARQVVNQVNSEGDFHISDERILQLITQLTSLMIQVQNLSTEDRNPFEVQVLEESLNEIQRGLHPDNIHCFQDCVEVHIQHIQQSLGLGSLNPFATHRP